MNFKSNANTLLMRKQKISIESHLYKLLNDREDSFFVQKHPRRSSKMKKESNLHEMSLYGLLLNGGIHHESKICQFVLQVIGVISSIIDDTASDKTNEENHLQRRVLL